MKKLLPLFFLYLISFGISAESITKKNICSITINSNTEINVFKSVLDPNQFNFIELTPNNKNPNWLQNACEQNIVCDSLVVSGHFGGVFFSETNSLTLDLEEMLTKSCSNKCSGIFQKVKEVYLLGCNTLASKDPDHRTYSQYLNVLVKDGISREYAEPIVATRYSDNGITIADQFSSIFPNAKKIYGFKSTGPLGAQSAGRLQKYLQSIPDYNQYFDNLSAEKDNELLAKRYAGTSFVQRRGAAFESSSQRDLMCKIYSENLDDKKNGFKEIVKSEKYDLFFNTLLTSKQNEFSLVTKDIDMIPIESYLNGVYDKYTGLREIQYRALKSLSLLNIISKVDFKLKLNNFLENIFNDEFDSISFDQVCTIAKNEADLEFKKSWINDFRLQDSVFLPRLVSCFKNRETGVDQSLLEIFNQTDDERFKVEIIRSIRNFSSQLQGPTEEMSEEVINSMTTQKIKNQLRKNNLSKTYGHCIDKTNNHWVCWNKAESQNSATYNSCLYGAENSTGETRTGLYWQCLTNFTPQITMTGCLNAASSNSDPESADDMRWYCWENLKLQKRMNISECYGLARSMVIKGNRIKANWNCNNVLLDQ